MIPRAKNSRIPRFLPTNQPQLTFSHSISSILALTGAFFALFCTVGFQNAFGMFQEYYFKNELRGRIRNRVDRVCDGVHAVCVRRAGGYLG